MRATFVLRTVLFLGAAATTAVAAGPLDGWILATSHGDASISGESRDLRRVGTLAGDGPFLWARRGGKTCLLRDAALLARAGTAVAPLHALDGQQGELGRRQGALGGQQGERGHRMAELARRGAEREPKTLAQAQEELGRQQEELGARQEELGRQMERASAATGASLAVVVDEARAAGLAQPLP